jgi:hypothetical protein
MVFFLAAITLGLFSSVLGADDTPFRPVMGKRGATVVAALVGATAGASSSTGVTTAAASLTVTPSRWARAASKRVGASPRVRSAASNTGRRTWIH